MGQSAIVTASAPEPRKASTYLVKAESYTDTLRSRAKLYAYALATAEEWLAPATADKIFTSTFVSL